MFKVLTIGCTNKRNKHICIFFDSIFPKPARHFLVVNKDECADIFTKVKVQVLAIAKGIGVEFGFAHGCESNVQALKNFR